MIIGYEGNNQGSGSNVKNLKKKKLKDEEKTRGKPTRLNMKIYSSVVNGASLALLIL